MKFSVGRIPLSKTHEKSQQTDMEPVGSVSYCRVDTTNNIILGYLILNITNLKLNDISAGDTFLLKQHQ